MSRVSSLILPSSSPQSYDSRIRWWSCENTTNEEIPPFACMQLKKPRDLSKPWRLNAEQDEHVCHLDEDGDVIWYVSKCDEEAEENQNTSQFVFNGPTPIPARRKNVDSRNCRGRCHQDFPAQALSVGRFELGEECGPAADSWALSRHRRAFITISSDATKPIGANRTIWVDRGRPIRLGVFGTFISRAFISVESEGFMTFGPNVVLSHLQPAYSESNRLASRWRSMQGLNFPEGASQDYLEITDTGLLLNFSFHATIWSADAPRGTQLLLSVYRQRPGEGLAPQYYASREQNVEVDNYGNNIHIAKESVSVSGIIKHYEPGDRIYVKNLSDVDVTMMHATFNVWQPDNTTILRAGIEEEDELVFE